MHRHHAILMYARSIEDSAIPQAYKRQSADIQHVSVDRFTIEQARTLSDVASKRAFDLSSERVFVIHTSDITVEAQNALLKLLEEPPSGVFFYILASRSIFLLPTLRSRLHIIEDTREYAVEDADFAVFAAASIADRFIQIAARTKAKDTDWTERVLAGCEISAAKEPQRNKEFIAVLVYVRSYIGVRGASPKMLLEEVALTLPS